MRFVRNWGRLGMNYNFEVVTIGDCCDIVKKTMKPKCGEVYTCFSLPAFDNSATPEILKGEDIRSSKFLLDENTILFNKLNPKFRRIWNIHSLKKYKNTICSTEFLPLKVKINIEQDFLYYYISSPYFTKIMDGIRTGTSNSQQRIDWKRFLQEPICLPPLSIQRKIASLLSNIDNKIKLNIKINNNLEQQLLSLYKQIINCSRKSNEVTLASLCNFQEGYVNPAQTHAEYFDGDVKWLRAVDINESFIINTSRTLTKLGFESAKKSALLFKPNTIAISKSGTIGRLGIIADYMCGNRAVINISPIKNDYLAFIYCYLKSKQREFPDMAVGSVQKNLYISLLEPLTVAIPENDKFHTFNQIGMNILNTMQNNCEENIKLCELRDLLLPKLMSGELDVSDIDL